MLKGCMITCWLLSIFVVPLYAQQTMDDSALNNSTYHPLGMRLAADSSDRLLALDYRF